MINKKTDIFENKNFNKFASQVVDAAKSAHEKFWEQDIKISLYAINDFRELRDESLVKNIDFFSSRIKVENNKPIIIRLSQDFVETFLSSTLEYNKQEFKLTNLTALEVKILNNFCEFVYKKLKDILISPKDIKADTKSEKIINFIFLVNSKEEICSKIIISIPFERINLLSLDRKISFSDEDFLKSNTIVKVKAGSSKITIEELQNLTKDDIVVLENSNISSLTLISGEFQKKFNVKANPSLIMNINNDEDEQSTIETYNEVEMEKNLWDDIQIEINAEFEKVKMTIGELKQITQGQIVDLGSVFDNEISLFVEEKKVAKGELIIINDRYAVRLNEVLSSVTPAQKTAPKPAAIQPNAPAKPAPARPAAPANKIPPQQKPAARPQQKPPVRPQPQPKPKPQPPVEDEEFDYSDFEK